MLPTTEDPGFVDDRSGVLRDTVLRTQIEAENPARKTLIISQRFFAIHPFRFNALAAGIHNNPRTSPSPADSLKNMPLKQLQGGEGQIMRKVPPRYPLTN
jgi:hypothetical protein